MNYTLVASAGSFILTGNPVRLVKTPVVESYASAALKIAVNHLANSVTWKSLTVDLPRTRLVYFTGGQPELTGQTQPKNIDGTAIAFASPMIFISQSEFPRERICQGYYKHTGQVELMVYLAPGEGEYPSDQTHWMLEKLDSITSEIEANIGASGYFSFAEVSSMIYPIPDPTGALAGYLIGGITIKWSNVP
jgi:hypothetical protein